MIEYTLTCLISMCIPDYDYVQLELQYHPIWDSL